MAARSYLGLLQDLIRHQVCAPYLGVFAPAESLHSQPHPTRRLDGPGTAGEWGLLGAGGEHGVGHRV